MRANVVAEGETALLKNLVAFWSQAVLNQCSADFSFSPGPTLRHLAWEEPVETRYFIVLDEELPLKASEGILLEAKGMVERGYSRLHTAAHAHEKPVPVFSDCNRAYVLIMPTVIGFGK